MSTWRSSMKSSRCGGGILGEQDSPNVLAGVFYGWLDSNRPYLAKGTTFRSYVNYRKQVRL